MDGAGQAFRYIVPELRVFSGEDSLAALAKELRRAGCRRAVVVSGRSVGGSPAMELLHAALGDAWIGESRTVGSNSPVPAVEATARALKDYDADAVIAVGGGSAAVTARAASVLLAEHQPLQQLCTRRLPDGRFSTPRLDAPKLPQFVVPTTPSTAFVKAGSAVHDADTGERLALFDPKTRARALFLHPAFLRTAPAGLVLGATLNTLSTAVEALESPGCDPFSEALLMQSLRLVARHVDSMEPDDALAREALAVAAVLCGRGTEQAGGGLASVLAHAIGHRAHVSNGIANAIVLPHTMRFNAQATLARHAYIAEALGRTESPAAVEGLSALMARLPVPHRLREIGIARDALDGIAHAAMSDFFIGRSARPVRSVDDVRGILEAAW